MPVTALTNRYSRYREAEVLDPEDLETRLQALRNRRERRGSGESEASHIT
jgi:hypothetical protein